MGTDIFSAKKRSEVMARVKSKNTQLELAVRSALHLMGYRFRLHQRDLPGVPDIVLPKYRTTVFVHGCFWHQHEGCKKATRPKQNSVFWEDKLARNVERDRQVKKELEDLGWNVVIIWECEMKSNELSNRMATVSKQINKETVED